MTSNGPNSEQLGVLHGFVCDIRDREPRPATGLGGEGAAGIRDHAASSSLSGGVGHSHRTAALAPARANRRPPPRSASLVGSHRLGVHVTGFGTAAPQPSSSTEARLLASHGADTAGRRCRKDVAFKRLSADWWRADSARLASWKVERRLVSILFCDLVGSVALAGRLEAEDYGALILAYRAACAQSVGAAAGTIAYYMGDGVLAYFGCPVAHEDDPVRAVHAGLDVLAALRRLNRRLEREGWPLLAARLAVHTGIALAGTCDFGAGRGTLEVIGDAPNVAARLHEAAKPGVLVASGDTFAAVRGLFEGRPLGPQALRGVAREVDAFEILAPAGGIARASGTVR